MHWNSKDYILGENTSRSRGKLDNEAKKAVTLHRQTKEAKLCQKQTISYGQGE